MNDNDGGVIRVWARSALSRRPLDIHCCKQELSFILAIHLNLQNTLYTIIRKRVMFL